MPDVLTYVCPFCDREVRVGRPCPGCAKKAGKPKKKSWEQDKSQDGLDLPDSDFDYDAFVAREFGKVPYQALGVKWYWWALAMALLAATIFKAFWIG